LESIPKLRDFTLHRQSLWKESKTSEREFVVKSEAVASKFSRGDTCVFLALKRRRRTVALSFILLPKGEERAEAPSGLKPLGLIMGFYMRNYRLAFKQDPLRKNQVG